MNYIQCIIPSTSNVVFPNIPIIDRHCSYNYLGSLDVYYVVEDTVTNRSALQKAEVYNIFPANLNINNNSIYALYNKDYNTIKSMCKCNLCHTKHKDYKLYKFFKQD